VSVGEQLKLAGIERAVRKYEPDLVRAQGIAELIGIGGRLVSSDEVREMFAAKYERPLQIGNAAGAIFRDKTVWMFVDRVKSTRKEAHARWISRWRLRLYDKTVY